MAYDYTHILEKNACIKYKDCVAYNSIGFYKNSLGMQLERPPIFNNYQGIYIKNNIENGITSEIENNKIVLITPCYRIENLKKYMKQ